MTPLDRTKVAVDPYALALHTFRRGGKVNYNPYLIYGSQARGLSGLHGIGLAGFWTDLFNEGKDLGKDWLENEIQKQGISNDIVSIQNQVSATMDQIANEYYPLRDSGQVTIALITHYQTAFQTLINSFCGLAQRMGTSRALAGCETIKYWGGKWIQDREAEKAALGGGGGVVPIDPVTGLPIPGWVPPVTSGTWTGGLQSALPLLMGAAFIFVLLKSSKRW